MAKFKIIDSQKKGCIFTVQFIDGELSVGDEFIVYDTDFACHFVVLKIEKKGDIALVHCDSSISQDKAFLHHIVDTENPEFAKRYRLNYNLPD